ncbi:hypothetical protein N7468_009850 [Penicillium chermesinum]|uniref:Uncharacterized protein n=1 Tax=Penicillium chermesinum TaxID=63820 RepID=A0A9W9TBN7_9EURO|nr:uncharacterized protein N7468_009850 [Penicillium chermesinum]KAJ5216842.1 hypothetical protein N7468_009850 [Penicillium chermesinum]
MHNAKSLRRGPPIGGGVVPFLTDLCSGRRTNSVLQADPLPLSLPEFLMVPNEYLSPIDRAQSGQADLVMRAEYEIEARRPASLPADQYVPGLCPSGFGPGKG